MKQKQAHRAEDTKTRTRERVYRKLVANCTFKISQQQEREIKISLRKPRRKQINLKIFSKHGKNHRGQEIIRQNKNIHAQSQ